MPNNQSHPFAGKTIGIVKNNTVVPLVPGNVCNATTYDFPVVMQAMVEFPSDWHCNNDLSDDERQRIFIREIKKMEAQGVSGITTGCGFYALFQKEAAKEVEALLFTSPLLLLPLMYDMLGKTGKIGVLTANGNNLSAKHLESCGVAADLPIVIQGMNGYPEFNDVILTETKKVMDTEAVKAALIDAAQTMIAAHPDIRAVLLECTEMPPLAKDIQDAIRMPVFDFIAMIRFAHETLNPVGFTRGGGAYAD